MSCLGCDALTFYMSQGWVLVFTKIIRRQVREVVKDKVCRERKPRGNMGLGKKTRGKE